MSSKLSRGVAAHIHSDLQVNAERVGHFGSATRDVQLQVQAELRRRANDNSNSTIIAIYGIAIAAFGLFVSPVRGLNLLGLPFWTALIVGALLALTGVVIAIPLAISPTIRSVRRERAVVWLAAFDDEVSRRRSARGRAGRRWHKSH